ncbi:MAG: hypothetical protein WC684_12815 [Hyphomicrobium sp.]|jgi:hypothetical protein
MQIAAKHAPAIVHDESHDATYRFAGLLIVALFPALFWTAVAAGIGGAVGYMPTPAALMTFGTAVATFCAAVGQALFFRN